MKINIRPFCNEFLNKCFKFFEIYIFTASSKEYAEAIINFLDPKANLIDGIISRHHCLRTKAGAMIKDVRVIGNRDLKDIIIVDNLAISFGKSITNGIPIIEFTNDENDKELLYLYKILKKAAKFEDVRAFIKEKFNLEGVLQYK